VVKRSSGEDSEGVAPCQNSSVPGCTVAGDPANYLIQNSARTADMILSVTDSRAAKTSNGAVRSAYQKLRKSVKGDVEAAVPGLANILATHVAASQSNVSL
jgi:hypothetical protein